MKSYLSIFSFAMLFLAISFTVSYAQIKWTKHPAPVLTPGPAGEWDEEFVGIPCVLFDGSTYHMWYSNYNYITGNHEKIGYATSTNGIMWTKYDNPTTTNPPYAESDPVLLPGSPGTYDDEWLSFPSVLLINSIYHMWYGASDDPAFAGHISICYATSPADCVLAISVLSEHFPNNYMLHQNYPNPFNPTTNIEFSILKSEFVTLKVYNILGEEVATLVSEKLAAGKYKYDWSRPAGIASGVYYYQLKAGDFHEVKKMVLIK